MARLRTTRAAEEAKKEPPDSPSALARLHNPRWEDARHTTFVDRCLVYLEQRQAPAGFLRLLEANRRIPDDVADDEMIPFTHLAIFEPPRHGKSEQCNRYFPAWYLGRHPDHHIISASYGDKYAASWGRKARNVLEGFGPTQFGIRVSRRTSAANDWEIEGRGGGMVTSGTGGAITGRGANVFIGDDLVKGAKDAASVIMQESAWDWWQTEASTRLESDADGIEPIVLLIMTRWNENDILGRILANEEDEDDGETWYVLRLPAIAEENDALGRKPGEALWPERRPLEFLQRIKRRISAYWWSALYQQRPAPLEGDFFKRTWWQRYTLGEFPSQPISGFNAIDTAGYDTKRTGDYAVIHSGCRVGRAVYSTNLQRGHWTFVELKERAKNTQLDNGWPLLIEDVPWAKPLIQSLRAEGCIVIPFAPGGHSKESRADAIAPTVESGNWYLPIGASWVDDFIEEMAAFPRGAHDDQVDTASMLGIRLLLGGRMPTMGTKQFGRRRSVPQQGWRTA